MRATAVLALILVLVGCTTAPASPTISLSELHPLPAQPATAVVPLRVSVAAVISPRGTAESYEPLLAYLSAKLNRPVELEQRRTYAETNDLVARGQVDLAFVCTSAYIAGHDAFNGERSAGAVRASATTSRLVSPWPC
jgi:phosphonate transport system substrate-binding protein